MRIKTIISNDGWWSPQEGISMGTPWTSGSWGITSMRVCKIWGDYPFSGDQTWSKCFFLDFPRKFGLVISWFPYRGSSVESRFFLILSCDWMVFLAFLQCLGRKGPVDWTCLSRTMPSMPSMPHMYMSCFKLWHHFFSPVNEKWTCPKIHENSTNSPQSLTKEVPKQLEGLPMEAQSQKLENYKFIGMV